MPKWYCLLCLEEGKAHTVEANFPLRLQLFLDRGNPQELSLARGGWGGGTQLLYESVSHWCLDSLL